MRGRGRGVECHEMRVGDQEAVPQLKRASPRGRGFGFCWDILWDMLSQSPAHNVPHDLRLSIPPPPLPTPATAAAVPCAFRMWQGQGQ